MIGDDGIQPDGARAIATFEVGSRLKIFFEKSHSAMRAFSVVLLLAAAPAAAFVATPRVTAVVAAPAATREPCRHAAPKAFLG